MAALLLKKQTPLMVQLPTGALVPLSALGQPTAGPAPAAAEMNDQGALGDPHVISAGTQGGNVAPAGDAPDQAPALDTHSSGGPAKDGALIATPKQPEPLKVMGTLDSLPGGADPTNGADAGLAGLLKLGKAAGKSGGEGTTAATGANDDSGGIMGFLHGLFNGSDGGTGTAPPVPVQVGAPDLTPTPIAANDVGALAPGTADVPVPTPRPFNLGDAVAPQQVQISDPTGALSAPQGGPISAATPALADQPQPNYFDRLKANPLALALLTGGLQTMSAASRPGATLGGSIGEGALGGIKTVFEQQAAEKERDLAARHQDTLDANEASENKLRGSQQAFYDARTVAEPDKTAALGVRADAAKTAAAARGKSADAAMVRADAYAKGGVGGKGGSVFQQKQQAWLAVPGQENDLQGALDYAGGHKEMSGSAKYLSARRLATTQLNGMVSPPDDPNWLDNTTATIMKQMDANDASRGNGNPGSNSGKSGPALGGKNAPATGALEAQAKAAIAKGADPAKVKARLKQMGGNPGAL